MDPYICAASAAPGESLLISALSRLTRQAIIPHVPTKDPRLSRPVYEMILGHLLINDKDVRSFPLSPLPALC